MHLHVHQLNYQHLLYFWLSVRSGSAAAAARKLRLSQSTVSTQVNLLQEALGVKLFERVGRATVVTDAGRAVLRYADEIFPHGQQLLDGIRDDTHHERPLRVGIADGVAKLTARQLLLPVIGDHGDGTPLLCSQADAAALIAKLVDLQLDVVLADELVASTDHQAPLQNHLLSASEVGFFATLELKRRLSGPFPGCLHAQPLLLPAPLSALRRDLQQWFDVQGVVPRVVAEIEDSALLKAMGQVGVGFFAAPAALATELAVSYGVVAVGAAGDLRTHVYGLTTKRRRPHPLLAKLFRSGPAT